MVAGRLIQDKKDINLHAAHGVTVREMQSHGGPSDSILFVDGKALGIGVVVAAVFPDNILFIACQETQRFEKFTHVEVVARDKANLDIRWLKDEGLDDDGNLPGDLTFFRGSGCRAGRGRGPIRWR